MKDFALLSEKKKEFMVILFFIFLVTVYFWQALLLKGFFFMTDITMQNYPLRHYFSENIRKGILPLWTPNLFCGYPLYAEGQAGVFYPLNVLFLILPTHVAYNYFIILHFFMGGIFMYAFGRSVNMERTSAVVSGVTFAFSNLFVAYHIYPNHLSSASWMPLIFCFFEMALKRRRFIYTLFGSICVGLQFLAGYPQFCLFTFLLLLFYLIYKVITEKEIRRIWFKGLTIIGLFFMIGFLLVAIQLLPFWEFVSQSNRAGGVSQEYATVGSLSIHNLLTFLFPNFLGNSYDLTFCSIGGQSYEDCINGYIGVFPLLFAVLGIILNRRVRFFIGVSIISVILSFGKELPFYGLLSNLPILNMIRYPSRFLLIYVFSMSVLAGMGVEYVKRRVFINGRKLPLKNGVIFIGGALILILALGIVYFRYMIALYIPNFNQAGNGSQLYYHLKCLSFSITRKADFLNFAYFSLTWVILITLSAWQIISKKLFQGLAVSLIATNLLFFGPKPPPLAKAGYFHDNPKVANFLKHDDEPFRFESRWVHLISDDFLMPYINPIEKSDLIQKLIGADTALVYGLYNFNGLPHSLIVKYYWDIFRYGYNVDNRLRNLVNVKYIVTNQTIEDNAFTLIFFDKDIKVYENKECFKRAFLVHNAIVENKDDLIIRRLTSPDFKLDKSVIIEESVTPLIVTTNILNEESVEFILYSHDCVELQIHALQPGFVILTDMYYPGWKVYVDGKENKIYRADYLFRAVYINSGKHEVKFLYRPISFYAGSLISGISFIFLVGAISLPRIRNARW